MITYILCVWLPLKMCQPMPLERCIQEMRYYQSRNIQATCEPQTPNRYPPR